MGLLASVIGGLIFAGQPHMPALPPVNYTGASTKEIRIDFKNPISVHIACGGDIFEFTNQSHQIFACAGVDKDWIVMPDPCAHKDESYARLLCHELGHTKGWPGSHPDAVPFKAKDQQPQPQPPL